MGVDFDSTRSGGGFIRCSGAKIIMRGDNALSHQGRGVKSYGISWGWCEGGLGGN